METTDFLGNIANPKILITSGASCPDAEVEKVIEKLLSFYPDAINVAEVCEEFE
jgi:4-hydroxy-3-methylbut-2-enyl diphosphate reductase